MKKICFFLMFFILSFGLFSNQYLTVAERSNFEKTSLYRDVIQFLFDMQKASRKIVISKLTDSFEGRMIPLVIISSQGIRSFREFKLYQKPVVLINANIHAGEVEGKEATLMLIRDFANDKMEELLHNQLILILPIFNPDGNEKLGHNRRDNGPEMAGVRYNGQHLDLNRDFLKLESPEVRALVKLFNQWDPVLFIDLHTTNGSYHREPVTYTTQINPNTDHALRDYMWSTFFPKVSKTLKEIYSYDSVPYGNFVDRFKPEKGWENWALEARFGFNYFGLRNRFSILNENYSHADFKTRIMSCYSFLKSILQFSNKNIHIMQKYADQSDMHTVQQFSIIPFALEYQSEKLFDINL
ncbi:MAG: M14 family metallopeptidase, partial [Candidatus Aminicenantes bacterium]|nr:M14 family metallopeptidase [Candidatus Aminicenantes bacterium]